MIRFYRIKESSGITTPTPLGMVIFLCLLVVVTILLRDNFVLWIIGVGFSWAISASIFSYPTRIPWGILLYQMRPPTIVSIPRHEDKRRDRWREATKKSLEENGIMVYKGESLSGDGKNKKKIAKDEKREIARIEMEH